MNQTVIPVTKPYLPSREKLDKYIDGIYEREWLTNNGPLLQELTRRLEMYLDVENLLLVSNGTLALQVAYRALNVSGGKEPSEAITTPFTFVATASSLKWEGVEPVFVDIDKHSWCLDPKLIKDAITPHTKAIVPVHVFGNACDVEVIDEIGREYGLKVIYDAAHAFGVAYKGESLLKYGDAATLSFHATKLFHTIEGGAIVFKRKEDLERARNMIGFGISGPDSISELGINAKMNEFQAAMGLCVLDEIEQNCAARKAIGEQYCSVLQSKLTLQKRNASSTNNYAYMPIVLESEGVLDSVLGHLNIQEIVPRRYFYPSLHDLSLYKAASCPVSKDIAARILCLPMFYGVDVDKVLASLREVI